MRSGIIKSVRKAEAWDTGLDMADDVLQLHSLICYIKRRKVKKPVIKFLLTNTCAKKEIFQTRLIQQCVDESKIH